jgi:hypothetical protein
MLPTGSRGGGDEPDRASGLSGREFTQSSLPVAAMDEMEYPFFATRHNRDVTELIGGQPVTQPGPSFGYRSVAGGGGGFLSNRSSTGLPGCEVPPDSGMPAGHVHTAKLRCRRTPVPPDSHTRRTIIPAAALDGDRERALTLPVFRRLLITGRRGGRSRRRDGPGR